MRRATSQAEPRHRSASSRRRCPLPGRYGEVEIEGFAIGTKEKHRVLVDERSWEGVPLDLLEWLGRDDRTQELRDLIAKSAAT